MAQEYFRSIPPQTEPLERDPFLQVNRQATYEYGLYTEILSSIATLKNSFPDIKNSLAEARASIQNPPGDVMNAIDRENRTHDASKSAVVTESLVYANGITIKNTVDEDSWNQAASNWQTYFHESQLGLENLSDKPVTIFSSEGQRELQGNAPQYGDRPILWPIPGLQNPRDFPDRAVPRTPEPLDLSPIQSIIATEKMPIVKITTMDKLRAFFRKIGNALTRSRTKNQK